MCRKRRKGSRGSISSSQKRKWINNNRNTLLMSGRRWWILETMLSRWVEWRKRRNNINEKMKRKKLIINLNRLHIIRSVPAWLHPQSVHRLTSLCAFISRNGCCFEMISFLGLAATCWLHYVPAVIAMIVLVLVELEIIRIC